jgi:hypothetical protein
MKYRIIYIWIIEVTPMGVNSNGRVINTEINANNENEVVYERVSNCKSLRAFGPTSLKTDRFRRKMPYAVRIAPIPRNNLACQ